MSHPKIEAVEVRDAFELAVSWSNGTRSVVDLSAHVAALKAFRPLRRTALFRQASVGEWGWSVRWTDDLEMSAAQLWRLALEQSGEAMTAEAFRNWRDRHGLSLSGAAEALGLSRRMVAYYDSGERLIPKTILLATQGYDATLTHRPKAA